MMNSKNKPILYTLLVMLLWGSLFPMVKLGYGAYDISGTGDILFFAGVRFTVCGAVICLYSYLTDKDSYRTIKTSIVPVLLSGVFAIILHYSFTYLGLSMTDSSKTAILKQMGALFYVCFSFLFFKEDRLTVRKLIAVIVGFLGIIAINADGGSISFNLGDFLILMASFCTVFSNVISKKALAKVKPVTMTGVSQLFGGVVLLMVGAAMGGSMSFAVSKSHIFLYICTASIISYCIWFSVVKKAELSKLFIIKFAEPVFACVFGAIILGENIWKVQYLEAFVLISLGIYIANMGIAKSE